MVKREGESEPRRTPTSPKTADDIVTSSNPDDVSTQNGRIVVISPALKMVKREVESEPRRTPTSPKTADDIVTSSNPDDVSTQNGLILHIIKPSSAALSAAACQVVVLRRVSHHAVSRSPSCLSLATSGPRPKWDDRSWLINSASERVPAPSKRQCNSGLIMQSYSSAASGTPETPIGSHARSSRRT